MFKNKDKKNKNFDDFIEDEEFEKILHEMEKIVGDAFNTALDRWESEKASAKRFSIRTDSDGKAEIGKIGDTLLWTDNHEGDVPADVIDGDESISVTIEIPTARKDDILIEVSDDRIEIQDNMYTRRIKLPSEVEPETARATYKNGILDVEMKKKIAGKEGHNIRID